MQIFKNPNVNFIGFRRYAFLISAVLMVLSLVVLFARGGPNYGIDFTGGKLVQITILDTVRRVVPLEESQESQPGIIDLEEEGGQRTVIRVDSVPRQVSTADLRAAVTDVGVPDAEIQEFGREGEFIVRYKTETTPGELRSKLADRLDATVRLERSEEVGPRVGRELRNKAIQALGIGLILMLLYISVRFNYRFGLGAVIALFHDVLIALGIFTLLNREVTTAIVAAFLTIVGYSINDSIVVSDRIRENLKKLGGKVSLLRFTEVVNQSINETLSRTVITAFTTLIVLFAILIFGGPVIFDFAFALAMGIVVGTYSSIFVVAALVVEARGIVSRSKSKK